MLPTRAQAIQALAEAEARNPGPWGDHCRAAALTAESIAAGCGLDADRAFALGLLHDIGRREGPGVARHIADGHRYCLGRGWDECARVCLTHSFPLRENAVETYIGTWDIGPEDTAFIRSFLRDTPFDDYDRLIQLCDALSLPSGPCLLEKRLVDVARRHGAYPFTVRKWEAWFSLLDRFSAKMGKSVYEVLPDVVENTFRP